jgi:hypothetical protein
MPEWDGVTLPSTYRANIVESRNALADAARAGDWAAVLGVLDGHPQWVNSCRIGGDSGFAPLHQAAWHGADSGVVDRLLVLGAWRTLRTNAGETARDIASRRKRNHLIGSLTPAILHPVRDEILTGLETNFHRLIRQRAEQLVAEHQLRLPRLAPLTEIARPESWFPVPGMYGGFRYRLEGEELIVDSWSRIVGGSEQTHRVTADGVRLERSGF